MLRKQSSFYFPNKTQVAQLHYNAIRCSQKDGVAVIVCTPCLHMLLCKYHRHCAIFVIAHENKTIREVMKP